MAQEIMVYTHYASPIILLVFFLVAFTAHSILTASKEDVVQPETGQTGPGGKPLPRNSSPTAKAAREKKALDFSPSRKLLFTWLSAGVVLTFLGNAVTVIVHALLDRKDNWWCGQAVVIYVVASFFAYSLLLISIVDTKPAPTGAHLSTWIVASILEIILLGASLALYTSDHREPKAGSGRDGQFRTGVTTYEAVEVLIDLLRILFLGALIFFYVLFVTLRWAKLREKRHAANGNLPETTGLLNGHQAEYGTVNGQTYGSIHPDHAKEEEPGWVRPTKVPTKSWWEYIRGYSLFFPYLWPAKSRRLQGIVIVCFVIVMIQRAVNLLVPIQAGRVTNTLAGENGAPSSVPWGQICLYIFYRFLQGGSGVLGAARSVMWIPIEQYSYRELSTASFEHVHGLSLDFHLGKKTGEVISAMSKGQSINTFLEQVTFQLLPMLVDLAVAFGYFLYAVDAYYALVVAIVTCAYLYITIRLAQWRADLRREYVNLDRQEDAVKNDSMVSYETVKYFNAETYEFQRYRNAVNKTQQAQWKVATTLNIMNISQNVVFTLGLMIVCFIAAYQVTSGQQNVGLFVLVLTYMAQLQAPLNFLGTFYRSIQQSMINAERMLELFKERPTVIDEPTAEELPSCQGEIRYNDVNFAYDPRKPALKGLSFRCAPGTTTALVGESGGGKSTVFRLLYRFYNLGGGSIQVDGHDVKDITIDSLRRHIGVVPQDTVLFNESLMYNLKYANVNATDEEVFEACRAASIHEKILNFPDGYDSRVGERGLKLSGGEKQRVAIARTILKNPRIILLDEATAALDTETEQNIQTALDKLSQGRTTLVIAHRLSTITTADQIMVLHAGKVAESGTHSDLLKVNGRYASMWRKQIRAQRVAEEAQDLADRAEKLRKEARGDESASQSEDERSGGNTRGRTAQGSSKPGSRYEDDGMPHGHP
ncbi:hypothetical protein HO133_009203 [Letharia lupina]|uniref:Heavy metal tolerance protein n=1 Tax=Letharia lupina TaxID=560253 RepID=A0A8H6CMP4_9LECA|nr:uncharacterized protein HO133_009203 [Letharia lupina]KAF6226337.1 hypothetical protein HO133_009203 [Letharia lupina]